MLAMLLSTFALFMVEMYVLLSPTLACLYMLEGVFVHDSETTSNYSYTHLMNFCDLYGSEF